MRFRRGGRRSFVRGRFRSRFGRRRSGRRGRGSMRLRGIRVGYRM